MEAKQPTETQIKEFWEWCGFKLGEDTEGEWEGCFYWHNPPNTEEWGATWLPPIDLNNLFKYAVPKLNQEGLRIHMLSQPRGKDYFFSSIGGKHTHVTKEDKDPALALFWAIWEVIKNG